MHLMTRLALTGLTAVSVCGLGVSAAGASTRAPAAASGGPAAAARAAVSRLHIDSTPVPNRAVPSSRRAGPAGLTKVESYNWSGYADINETNYSKVSASWTEPKVFCTKEDRLAAFWVGIDGYNSATVEQDGTLAQCFEGKAYYYSWWEMYPTNAIQVVGSTVRPGDHIVSSVVRTGTSYKLTVTDTTTAGNNVSTTQACQVTGGCANSSTEWIAEAPTGTTGQIPLAQFTPWRVQSAAVATTAKSGHISSFPDSQLTMIDSTGTYPLATPSNLNHNSTGFTDTWHNSF